MSASERQKKSRKQRQLKACYPCRQRKVKCTGVPCRSCLLRGQPQFCSMEPQTPPKPLLQSPQPAERLASISTAGSDVDGTSKLSANTGLRTEFERPRLSPKDSSVHPPSEAVRLSPASHTATPYLRPPGLDTSVSNQLCSWEVSSENDQTPLNDDISTPRDASLERLDQLWSRNICELVENQSDVVLPLEDLHSRRRSISELCLALPSNLQIERYYRIYSDILLPLYPGIVNAEAFESELQSFLKNRDQILACGDKNSDAFTQYDASWFALLFAVLSSGAQCLSTVDKEAELNSKVFGSISVVCLRTGNFLTFPTINVIQALLLIGNSLRNDMNPGAAWSLLGLTIRLAQIIGCHNSADTNDLNDGLATTKIKLWWSIVWQDMALAISYGHPSGTLSVRSRLPPVLDPNGHYTFTDVLDRICSIALQFLRQQLLVEEVYESPSCDNIHQLVQKIENIHMAAQPHLLSADNCITLQQYVEYFTIAIYKNHTATQILQSGTKSTSTQNPEIQNQIRHIILDKSIVIIESFLKLRQLSILSSHYWAVLQASVAAAKFLMTQGRTADRQKTTRLVRALLLSLTNSCDKTISVVNGFSTSLTQTVSELTSLLDP